MKPTLLAAWALLSPVLADPVATLTLSKWNCLMGCFDALALAPYADIPPGAGYYPGYCNSMLFTTSLVASIERYCSSEDQTAGWAFITSYCKQYGLIDLPSRSAVQAKIAKPLDELPVISFVSDPPKMVNETVVIDQESFFDGSSTENVMNKELNTAHAFGWSMYILVGAAVLLGLLNRLFISFQHVFDGSRPYTWYQKHISVPALVGSRHCEPWGWITLPTRLQGLFIFSYVAINFIFSFVDYDLFNGNLDWPTENAQLARYVADRTGIMSFYNLPLLFAFSGRNDVMIWIAGWSYSNMNLFHRWIARVAVAQAIAHSAAYTWIERDFLELLWETEVYWSTGIFATIVMSLILPFAILPLRQRLYEVFLILHILMAAATLILLYYHVTVMSGDYNGWIWACITVWVFDRGVRIARVMFWSSGALLNPTPSGCNATLTAGESERDLMRFTITVPNRGVLKPSPGQYYFLWTPISLRPWENHPFSLASWDVGTTSTDLHFLIGARKGATKRMYDRLLRTEGATRTRVLAEGPYGHSHDLTRFHHLLFVAGGSGITAILPYIFRLIKSPGVTRRVTLIWAVRHVGYAHDVLQHELAHRPDVDMEIRLHVTRGAGGTESKVELEEGKIVEVPRVQTVTGRPRMKELIGTASDTVDSDERLAVVACGASGMMDEMRSAVVDSYGSGMGKLSGARLQYFEEHFFW